MKKFLALCLAVIMVLTVSVTAFAAPGSFVQSPSANDGPQLIEGENESEDCTAKIIITPYKLKHTLNKIALLAIEEAYRIISECKDLTTLNAQFKDFVKALGLNPIYLAVSDLFDISCYGCDNHDHHGAFRIKFSADTLKNFVGLLHYHNGEWEFVENAKVLADGETLEFTVDELSPFAIVVDTGAGSEISPETGSHEHVAFGIAVLGAVALAVTAVSFKKKES